MFEVDEAVNKIRAEVDPEAELIFGSIEDENLNGKIRVSIVATSLDAQTPQTKPVISMVHRLQNRNVGYVDSSSNLATSNQPTLSATEGATALDLNTVIEQNNIINSKQAEEIKESKNTTDIENISMENAEYLQNMESTSNDLNSNKDEDISQFEVDSIELITPELFSDNGENNSFNQDIENEIQVFDTQTTNENNTPKELEMFEETNMEEDFEIPAFLRRQKN